MIEAATEWARTDPALFYLAFFVGLFCALSAVLEGIARFIDFYMRHRDMVRYNRRKGVANG